MTDLLAIVRSDGEAAAAFEAGADAVAIAAGPGQAQASRPLARCGPMLTGTHPDPVRAAKDAAMAGFDRVWLPLSQESGPPVTRSAVRPVAVGLTVPLGSPLDAALCDAALAAGAAEVLVTGAPFGAERLLDAYPTAVLAGFIALGHDRGLPVGLAGGIEAPDVPRLLALAPASLGLDTLLRDGHDHFAPDRLRAARSLWAGSAPVNPRLREPDRIFVHDWTAVLPVGAYASERDARQRVRFSVDADLAPAADSAEGMAGVVSYDLITDAIERLASRHVDFVETLAESVAATLLAHPRVFAVTVIVEKLDRGPGSVGCRIVRHKHL